MTKLIRELAASGVPEYSIELRRLRLSKGLTLHGAAQLAGLPWDRLGRLERYELSEHGYEPKARSLAHAQSDATKALDAIRAYEPDDLATRMHDFRARMNLSPREAAEMAGISPGAWSYSERGHKYGPRPAKRAKIEALLARWVNRSVQEAAE